MATVLRITIWLLPMATALGFTFLASRVAPPEAVGLNRWVWTGIVFVLANVLLAVLRRLVGSLTPLVALMSLTLVFPDQAPSRAKTTLRRSSSRSMLRQLEEQKASGQADDEVAHGDYLLQLLTEVNEHDRLTRGHSERVRAYAEMLGEELGLGDDDMNKLRWAALLHDVGKLEVPHEILNKDGRPTEEEWEILSNHPAAAIRMLEPLREWLGDWVHAADQHHCRWDGTGYPWDLAGTDIALSGRIVAVADAYDVMTSTRSYKKPLSADVARRELTECAGTQFDPEIVRAFLRISLGRLRMVSGPFGWLVNLVAAAEAKIPFAASAGPGLTSAATLVTASAATLVPSAPVDLPLSDDVPAPVVADGEAIGDEDQPLAITVSAAGGAGTVTFRFGPPANGEVAVGGRPSRRTVAAPAETGAAGEALDPSDDPDPADASAADLISIWEQSVTYRPRADFNGRDAFTVEACDTAGRCSSATTEVEVRPINDEPRAVDDRTATERGSSVEVDVLANDGDVDGDPLTIVDVEDPLNGEAILAGDRIVYVPDPGFVGEDETFYVVADPAGFVSRASLAISVTEPPSIDVPAPDPAPTTPPTTAPPTTAPPTTSPPTTSPPTTSPPTTTPPTTSPPPVNLSPIAVDDRVSTDEDLAVVVDVLANDLDPDGDPLTLTGIGAATNGVATIEGGRIRYEPNADHNGTDEVTYVVSDGVNPQVVGTLRLAIDPVNDAPTIAGPASATVPETAPAGTVVAALTIDDADGEPLTVAIAAGDATARFQIDGDGILRVAAALDFESTSSYPLEIEVDDGAVITRRAIAVAISDVNEDPVAADDGGAGFTTTEDVAFTTADVTANDSDVDDPVDPSGLSVVAGPTDGSLIDNGDGTFDYQPDPDWAGTDTFTYTITDAGAATSTPATVTITVTPVNDAPDIADPGAQTGAEDMPFSLAIAATDIELDGLSYGASGLPAGLGIGTDGVISGDPDPGTQGSHSVDVTVTDDGAPPRQTTVSFTLDIGYHEVSPQAGAVVINEILYASVDVTAPEEFVELTNRSGAPVDLTGWVLADSNLKATGSGQLGYTVPATDHWGSASTLAPGDYAIVWVVYDGANLPPLVNPASGLEYVVNVAGTKLRDTGDDLWLHDDTTAVVDYVSWGTGAGTGAPPDPALGLWDATFQTSLSTAAGQSISLTPNAGHGDDSACWEPTSSDEAVGRCAGATPTNDNDGLAALATSVGRNNNHAGADAGGPYAIVEGDALVLDGSGSDGASSWDWDLDNDGQYDDATTVSPSVPWSLLSSLGIGDDGVHPIGLAVDGGTTTDSTTLTITNLAPTLSTSGTGSVATGGLYTLNLGAIDPGDDTVTSWTINWGDGSIETISGNPSTATHTYTGAGLTYNILASASDEDTTVVQNELLAPSYNSDEVFRFAARTGVLDQTFPTGTRPIETLVGPDGNLYVSGQLTDDVRRYDATTGAFIDVFVTSGSGGLADASGFAFGPDGNLYVASYSSDEVLRYDGTTGAHIDVFATGMNGPYDVVFGPDLNLYVNQYNGDRVQRYDGSTGSFIDNFVAAGSGGLNRPEQMTFGPDGNLYVASSASGDVLRYDGSTGAFIDVFVASGGAGDLDSPAGLAFGPDGELYVSDLIDHVILRYDGTTGAFINEHTVPGVGGIDEPALLTFVPDHQVTVTP